MAIITEGAGLDLSRGNRSRRRFLARALAGQDLKILEIGALDGPTFQPDEGNVRFADFFTQEESIARHRNNPKRRWDRIVPVDYVLRDTSLPDAVTEAPELIVANHVIEHIADPISWLQDLHRLGARHLFLSIPDRRFTFDYFKPVTDATDWLQWHEQKLTKPSWWQVLQHIYYHAALRSPEAWRGEIPADHLHRFTMPEAIERAKSLSADHADVHCSIFTFESFRRLMSDLAHLIPWRITHNEVVQFNENEFRVLLDRR